MKKAEPMYLTHAREFIAKLDKYLIDPHSRVDVNSSCTRLAKEENIIPRISSGMSRTCVIYDDFVVKFDTGNSYYGHSYSEFIGYKNAIRAGYDHLFAPMHHIKVNNRYYYVMERVSYLAIECDDYCDYDWCDTDFYDEWVDNHFCDLHDENWGFDEEDNPKLIDYAFNDFFIPASRRPHPRKAKKYRYSF